MKSSKQDKQFMIQFDQANRDFLNTQSIFFINYELVLMSFFVSVLALFFSLTTALTLPMSFFIKLTIVVTVFIMVPAYCLGKKAGVCARNANLINEQLQTELLIMYPEYKNKHR